jgi:hypothetical protein
MNSLAGWVLLLAFQAPKPLEQQSFSELTTDDKDGRFDMSKYLLTRGAFLPVPMIITEPAVGYGGGLAAIFFHKPAFGDPDEPFVEKEDAPPLQIVPRSVSFAAGAGTVEGSYFAGAGHFEAWDEGSWRALGAAGYAAPHLKYYGEGTTVDLQDDPLEYTIRTAIVVLQLQRRIAGSLFIGLRYLYLDSDVSFEDRSATPPGLGIPSAKFHLASAGLGLPITYDSRDSVMTPTRGFLIDIRPQFFDESLGGDTHFFRIDSTLTGYLPIPPFIWSGRIKADFVSGKPPFYQLPFVEMRGVPVLRYLGRDVVSAETELEYLLTTRWSVLGFGGLGKAEMDADRLDSGETVYAGGVGFRYLIARRFGLKAGMDFAWSNNDRAFYIQVGTAWR